MARIRKGEAGPSIFEEATGRAPLAARMRPRTLDQVAGQRHLLDRGRALRESIESGNTGSILFWGPPGTGKTTLARLIARYAKGEFVQFSAVTDGIPRIREIVADAERRLVTGVRTVLFIDEIHRFNRGQQDALLPHVEAGTVTLIGATTENPSFELNGALLSRLRVYVLEPLTPDDIKAVIERALVDKEHGLGDEPIALDEEAMAILTVESDGDARRALTVLEAAVALAGSAGPRTEDRGPKTEDRRPKTEDRGPNAAKPDSDLGLRSSVLKVTGPIAREALQWRSAHYDKVGEEHYNLISAYHKALRGSDPQGALYWLARMIDGGEDPMYIARRTVRFASEDVGLADPRALEIAIAARDAYHFLGTPEGELALAEAAVYLATAPKSNRVYEAWSAALAAARDTPAAVVPKHIRNAPTKLMKELGYGAGYQYAHSVPEGYLPQEYLPDEVADAKFYEPTGFGFEKEIAKRLEWWDKLRRRMADGGRQDGERQEADGGEQMADGGGQETTGKGESGTE
jgi:putative ATPase